MSTSNLTVEDSKAMFNAGFAAEMRKAAATGIIDSGKAILGGAGSVASAGKDSLLSTMLFGGAAGALGGAATYAIGKRLSGYGGEEEEFNDSVAAMYENKAKELGDSRWYAKVKTLRDDLKKNYKKMTTEEYAAKYKELQDALDERRG